ncbi:MAG: hypothetical protein H6817_10615 [Phycisphaerales bacterium]|nr:hypothetical protein [Phycisphaerales bacterium]
MYARTLGKFVMAALLAAACIAAVPAANDAIQTDLRTIASTEDAGAKQTAWDRIRQADTADRTALLQQLAIFTTTADNERDALLAGTVIREFKIPDDTVVQALVPLLESDDASLKAQVGNMLGGYEDRSADRPPNFSTYRAIIATAVREDRPIPLGLVEHMYTVDPSQALRTMLRASSVHKPASLREILMADHVISEVLWKQRNGFLDENTIEPQAAEELAKLANHDQWWARLYAAAIVQQHPAFRTKALVQRLSGDEHPLVAGFASVPAEAERTSE